MRKRVLSLLLVLAMLMSMTVVAVEAVEAAPLTGAEQVAFGEEVAANAATMQFPTAEKAPADDEGYEAWCPVCQKTVTWLARGEGSAYAENNSNVIAAAADRHYYLVGDLVQIQQYDSGPACVHLNNHNVLGNATYPNAVAMGNGTNAVLNIMGSGNMTGIRTDGNPVSANINGTNPTLNLYGGTMKKLANIQYAQIILYSNRTINLFAGATIDGTATAASTNSGNVYLAGGTFNVYGGKIINGKGGSQGGNVFVASGALNMYGGEISGGTVSSGAKDVYVKSGTFYVEGKSVIGQVKVADAATFTAGTLTEGADIGYAKETAGRIFAEQKDLTQYIHAYEEGGSVLMGAKGYMTYSTPTYPAGYCPVCDETVTWTEFSGNLSAAAHQYLTYTGDDTYTLGNGTCCFHLNGNNLIGTSTGANSVALSGGADLRIMGKGTISANRYEGGGVTFNIFNSGNTLSLYGGKITKNTENTDGTSLIPAISSGHTLNINDGTVFDLVNGTSAAFSVSGGTVVMNGGKITGANRTEKSGGALSVSGGSFTMNGGVLDGNAAKNGGNIYMSGGNVTINGGKIINGRASNSGGNIMKEGGVFVMNGGLIANGVTTGSYAGNIRSNGGGTAMQFNGGRIEGGTAGVSDSANIHISSGQIEFKGTIVNGGAIYVASGTGNKMTVTGGQVNTLIRCPDGIFATGRVSVGAGYTVVATVNNYSGRIANASVEGFGPGFINKVDGKLSIDVALTNALGVQNLELKILDASGNVLATTRPTAECLETLTGAQTASLTVSTMLSGSSENWKTEGDLNKASLPASMALYVNGLDFALKTCTINGADKETALGTAEWEGYFAVSDTAGNDYATLEDALANAEENAELIINGATGNDFVQIQKPVTLNVAQGVTVNVDLNGKKVTVKGEGTVNCIDSTGDEWNTPLGSVKKEGNVQVSKDVKTADKRYLGVQNNAGDYIFFRVEIKLTAMTLNAQIGAIYYKSTIQCAQALGDYVEEFGVVYSLIGTPDGTEDANQWAKMTGTLNAGIENGFVNNAYSTFVYNIVKEGEANFSQNLANGAMPIYANPYLLIDGETVLGYEENNGVSLEQLVRSFYTGAQGSRPIDQIAAENAAKAELLNSFCVKYGLTSWQTNN